MNAERLLALYERVAEAPDAIARLRRFILDLAVRGKLVPQDPNDEPASELLKRIAKEKARLVKVGTISRDKPLPQLTDADIVFELPRGWKWARLGHLTMMVTSGSRDWAKHYSNEGAIFVRMGNLSKDHYRLRLDHIQRVKAPSDGEGTRTRLEPGDILISITGDVGMLGRIPEGFGEAYINQHTAMVRPMAEMKGRYLAELFRSPFAQGQFNEPQRGIKNSFRLTDVTQFVVPLPPLAEQHRIVAKVDELMALCDRLESAQKDREAKRDRLSSASLARLNTPDPETFTADARFTLEALPALTTRPNQIKQFRQTILNLAVRGKLVPQDPSDEPASELLTQIAKEDAREGKREKAKAEIDNEEELSALPLTWRAVPLIALGAWAIGSGFPKTEQGSESGPHFFLKVSDMNLPGNEKYITTANNFIDDDAARRMRAKIHPAGTIIFPKIGGAIATNKRRILTRGSAIDNNCLGITFSTLLNIEWAYLLLTTFDFTKYQAGTAVPALQQGVLERIPVGLPPLAEQHRIVAKVDELMALCDRLEVSLTTSDQTRTRLLEATLTEALSPASASEKEAAE